jgi:hypothetical protein
MGTRGGPGADSSQEVGARATGTRGAPGATLSWEVGVRAIGTRGTRSSGYRQHVASSDPTAAGTGDAMCRQYGAEE